MRRHIAIDGPAGSGKTEVAKRVARELGFLYLDSGATYRAPAAQMLADGIDPADEGAVIAAIQRMQIQVAYGMPMRIWCNGQEWTDRIRTTEVAMAASTISRYRPVRDWLVALQRRLATEQDVVMEGRDITTVVLPDAPVKIFLTAEPEVRARRRWEQMGRPGDLADVMAEIAKRDAQDTGRKESPLRQAPDAVRIDSTHMTLEEVVAAILSLAAKRTGAVPLQETRDA